MGAGPGSWRTGRCCARPWPCARDGPALRLCLCPALAQHWSQRAKRATACQTGTEKVAVPLSRPSRMPPPCGTVVKWGLSSEPHGARACRGQTLGSRCPSQHQARARRPGFEVPRGTHLEKWASGESVGRGPCYCRTLSVILTGLRTYGEAASPSRLRVPAAVGSTSENPRPCVWLLPTPRAVSLCPPPA